MMDLRCPEWLMTLRVPFWKRQRDMSMFHRQVSNSPELFLHRIYLVILPSSSFRFCARKASKVSERTGKWSAPAGWWWEPLMRKQREGAVKDPVDWGKMTTLGVWAGAVHIIRCGLMELTKTYGTFLGLQLLAFTWTIRPELLTSMRSKMWTRQRAVLGHRRCCCCTKLRAPSRGKCSQAFGLDRSHPV